MRHLSLALLTGFFLLLSSPLLRAQVSPDTLMAQGMAFYNTGDYGQALPLLLDATEGYRQTQAWEAWTDGLSACAGAHVGLGSHLSYLPTLHAAIDTLKHRLGAAHKLVGSVCNDLGSLYASLEDCPAAMPLLKEALAIRRQTLAPDNPSLGTTLINLSTCAEHTEGLEASNAYLEQALTIWQAAYGPEDEHLAKIYTNMGWNYGQLGMFDQQLAYYQIAVDLREKGLDAQHPQLASAYINLGMAYYYRNYYHESLSYLQKAQDIYQANANANPYRLAQLYNNLAAVYDALNDLPKARGYLWQLLETDISSVGKDHFFVSISYFHLAEHYFKGGEYPEALGYIREALRIQKRQAAGDRGSYQLNYGKALSLCGEIFLALGNTDSAILKMQAAEQAFAASGSAEGNLRGRLSLLEAQVYARMGRPEAARQTLETAVAFWGEHPRAVATLVELGELSLQQQRPGAAQTAFDRAAAILTAAGKAETHPMMLAVLAGQAEARYRGGTSDTTALKAALRLSQQAAGLIAAWRRASYSLGAREQHLAEAARIFETGMHAAWALYQQAPKQKWLEQAFALSEQGKATLLYQGLREGEALRTGNIPAVLLSKERQLRLDRAFYQRKLYETDAADSVQLARWRRQLFQLDQKYDSLIARIENRYPAYYQLKYADQTSDLDGIQDFLAQQQAAALCYVTGHAHSYLFFLAADTAAWLRLPKEDSLNRQVGRLRRLLLSESRADATSGPYQARLDSLYTTAHELYQTLIAPMAQAYPLPERLFIVPDGPLGYLSYDLLLSAPPLPDQPPAYFIYEHALAYGYSATLLQYQSRRQRRQNAGVLAVAPAFGSGRSAGHRGDWGPLQHNEGEAATVQSLMGGRLLTGLEAREATFRDLAPRFSLLHLSGHAQVDDANPLFSRVAFAPARDSSEDGQLDLAEILALPLDAEMVVLSACETGTGKLMRGEGIASLARGFALAGAQSIVTTLWPVHDATSARIMGTFYEKLKEGLSKDEALRQAKLSYLAQSDRLGGHPFFWAGYIPVGDVRPLPRNRDWGVWIGIALLLMGTAGVGRWYWGKRKKPIRSGSGGNLA